MPTSLYIFRYGFMPTSLYIFRYGFMPKSLYIFRYGFMPTSLYIFRYGFMPTSLYIFRYGFMPTSVWIPTKSSYMYSQYEEYQQYVHCTAGMFILILIMVTMRSLHFQIWFHANKCSDSNQVLLHVLSL